MGAGNLLIWLVQQQRAAAQRTGRSEMWLIEARHFLFLLVA
jgi:hypothetical protein